MTLVVAIHQPNFFPWLGFFNKLKISDKFVFLDDVQFPKTGGVWTNRVKMLSDRGPNWETAPIDRSKHGLQTVGEVRFKEFGLWKQRFMKSVRSRYCQSDHFEEIHDFIKTILEQEFVFLSEFNLTSIATICDRLQISTPTFRSSSLEAKSVGSRRLCELTAAVGGTHYLSGSGASRYLEPEVFREEGIDLRIQKFVEQNYPQQGSEEFVPGLSVLDALMNVGWEGTRELIS